MEAETDVTQDGGVLHNVGIAKHERFECVNFCRLFTHFGSDRSAGTSAHAGPVAGYAECAIWANRQRLESRNARASVPDELRCGKERTREPDAKNGCRTRAEWHYGKCRGSWSH